jgi:hypothetical protein
MFNRFFVSLTLSVFCALLLTGCGGSETPTTNSTNATGSNQTATTTTTTTTTSTPTTTTTTSTPASTATTTTTAGGDKVGVPECDDFIDKYEACLSTKVPAEARAQWSMGLQQWRTQWRQLAQNPQTKGTLAQACKMAAEQTRASMKPYGCDF